jgi:hypothetical protein
MPHSRHARESGHPFSSVHQSKMDARFRGHDDCEARMPRQVIQRVHQRIFRRSVSLSRQLRLLPGGFCPLQVITEHVADRLGERIDFVARQVLTGNGLAHGRHHGADQFRRKRSLTR